MHCVLLGVTKLLLSLWLEPSRSRGTFHCLNGSVNILNNRLKLVRVPSLIHRKPRGLNDLKHWKGEAIIIICNIRLFIFMFIVTAWCPASEYRSWLLYYSIPVLEGVLNKDYFEHYILLSESIWLLLQSSVSFIDIDRAERMLQHFCIKFSSYYGQYIYSNIV